MTTTLRPAPVGTGQFHYDAHTRTFTAEASDTNGLGRVWDDAADEGLTLVSSRTGRERVFVVTDEHRDADGDVTHWTLKSVTGRAVDAQYTLTLFND